MHVIFGTFHFIITYDIIVWIRGGNMLKTKDILDDKNKKLRHKNREVTFPISEERKELINSMVEHLRLSQSDEMSKKYNLRPGMGLAAPQLGINETFFVVVYENKKGTFNEYIAINPKVLSVSKELIYAGAGEGCLSVNREVEGIVPRHARITVEAYDMNGKKRKFRIREEEAIAFEHELDHLKGIMFYDKIDQKNPFLNSEEMRMI